MTPVGGGQSTPTAQPTVAAATATPAAQAVGLSSPGPTAPSAVAAAATGPGPQGFPVTGARPNDAGFAWPGLPLILAGALAALTGGFVLMNAHRRRAAEATTASGRLTRASVMASMIRRGKNFFTSNL